MRLAALAAFALALVVPPALAQVPDPFARHLARQLVRVEALVRDRGYSHLAGPLAGGAGQGETASFPVTLRAGGDYAIIGVCDVRCSDLDLRLSDPGNVATSEDALADNAPVIGVRPVRTGVYELQVIMARCAAPQCYFAVNVYGR